MYLLFSPNMRVYARCRKEVDMEEKPIGALGVITVLALTILVFWLGVYVLFLARG